MKNKIVNFFKEYDLELILCFIIICVLLFALVFSINYNTRKEKENNLNREMELREQAFVYEHSEEYSSFTNCIRIYDRYYCKND